jgi:hypothetical protein
MLRIKMTDGRVLIGEFNCTDRDANVIMSMTSECSAEDDSEERLIGKQTTQLTFKTSAHFPSLFQALQWYQAST